MKRQDIQGDPELSTLLRQSQPAPSLPPGFQEAVWQRIDRAKEDHDRAVANYGFLVRLAETLLRPRFAVATLSAILAFGLLAGAWAGQGHALTAARARYVASVVPWQVQ